VASIARPHVPEEELHAYCDGELSPSQRVEIAEHLLGCLICRSQRAEVEGIRTQASALLAIASPPVINRPALPQSRPIVVRRRSPGMMVAAAAAVIGIGAWFSLRPVDGDHGRTQMAVLGFSGFFRLGHGEVDHAAVRSRQLTMASRTMAEPQVEGRPAVPPPVRSPLIGEAVDPVATPDWALATMDDALTAGNGKLARLSDVPVKLVRIHPSALGGRPTFMVRQELPDGRSVWVFEGLEGDIAPVDQMLQASGIAMSMATRTRPDYVNTGVQTAITARMVRVVGYLPADSLNVLAQKLVLR
jgi:anti-sigma factor RsiW